MAPRTKQDMTRKARLHSTHEATSQIKEGADS